MGMMPEIFLSFFFFFPRAFVSVRVFKYDLRVLHFGPWNLVALQLNIAVVCQKTKTTEKTSGPRIKGPVRICLADSPASLPLSLSLFAPSHCQLQNYRS